jgi:hypothetical protein
MFGNILAESRSEEGCGRVLGWDVIEVWLELFGE